MKKINLIALFVLALSTQAFSQKEIKYVAFSGYALTADSLIGVPFAHVTIINGSRRMVAEAGMDGYFSFAAAAGDTLYFTSVGFKPAIYVLPKKLENENYSVIQPMTRDAQFLPTTFIYPWSRDNFRVVFMETRPPKTDMDRAMENLSKERLAAAGVKLAPDGTEIGNVDLRSSSAARYYYGQTAPQNIFNPLAWAQFIQAWKNGDFKKKEDAISKPTVDPTANPQY